MNNINQSSKIRATHLARCAMLYVRQSTMRQVVEHTESTQRQYALRQRATALGWPEERITVIDSDQGQSGASATDRLGFQQLVAEVGMGRVGLVMGLEVSRLARNNADWHQLLQLCAHTQTLILDEDGIYEPSHFNDRLLLGLKGTMSEAELYVLNSRLRGGIESKARRGELKMMLPVGFVYDELGHVILDPDTRVQETVRLLFTTFARTGTAGATTRYFGNEKLRFPRRIRKGPKKGELIWNVLTIQRTVNILRNPRYSGTYVYGRTRDARRSDGRIRRQKVPRENWSVVLPDAHPGYITWERYNEIDELMEANVRAYSHLRSAPPREGTALLQGLVVCGVCRSRMTPRYGKLRSQPTPRYLCQAQRKDGAASCQSIRGVELDIAVGELVVEAVSPAALEASLEVQRELSTRIAEADKLRYRLVERAQYEMDRARRRFMCVEPENRLVAATLEGDYNDTLRALAKAREDYERQRKVDQLELTEEVVSRVRALASDFPRLWNDPSTPVRDRKRMIRLIIEDITLTKDSTEITAQILFRSGATRTIKVPNRKPACHAWKTKPHVVELIDQLLDEHTYGEIAAILNERGLCTGHGNSYHSERIRRLIHRHGLRRRFDRLRARGLLTAQELAVQLNCDTKAVSRRQRQGTLPVASYRVDDKGVRMYAAPVNPSVTRTAV